MRLCFRVVAMDADSDLDQRIAGIAALDQPVRRDLYRLLCRAEGWTSRGSE